MLRSTSIKVSYPSAPLDGTDTVTRSLTQHFLFILSTLFLVILCLGGGLLLIIILQVIRHLGIVGECNIQFALHPESERYVVVV